jgi:hypothetical protein
MVWRVVATQQGHYNQVLREIGEVFDLLCYADGTFPIAVKYTQKKDATGKLLDEWDEEQVLGKDKKPVHRDFAEDQGYKLITRGPVKGDSIRFGWMKRVPDRTPLGQYPPVNNGELPDFWSQNVQLPQAHEVIPGPRSRGQQDPRRNHAPILDVLPKEQIEAA